jgi:hypothetical protein
MTLFTLFFWGTLVLTYSILSRIVRPSYQQHSPHMTTAAQKIDQGQKTFRYLSSTGGSQAVKQSPDLSSAASAPDPSNYTSTASHPERVAISQSSQLLACTILYHPTNQGAPPPRTSLYFTYVAYRQPTVNAKILTEPLSNWGSV